MAIYALHFVYILLLACILHEEKHTHIHIHNYGPKSLTMYVGEGVRIEKK